MFQLDEKSKSAKEKVLQEIMDLMDSKSGATLKGLKKPAVMEMSVEKLTPEEDDAGDEEGEETLPSPLGESDDEEPSEEDKAKIRSLYDRYCK